MSEEFLRKGIKEEKLYICIHYNYSFATDGRMCNADLEYLKSAQANPNLTEAMASMLTAQGEQDTRLFAKRLQSAFPELLRPNPQTLSTQDYKV